MITSWLLISIGAILQYPAVFEDSLPRSAALFISTIPRATALPYLFIICGWSICLTAIVRNAFKNHSNFLPYLITGVFLSSDSSFNTKNQEESIFLISIDSLRADAITAEKTPNLYRFKNQHTSFEQHFVGIPRTFPSWIETLESQPAALSGIRHMFPTQPERQQQSSTATFAQALSLEGFHTALISDFAGDIFPRFENHYHTTQAPTFTLPSMLQLNITTHLRFFLPYILTPPLRSIFPEIEASPIATNPQNLIHQAIQHLRSTPRKNMTTLFFSTAHFPYASPWPYYPAVTNETRFIFQKNPDLSYTSLSSDEKKHIIKLYESSIQAIDHACGALFQYLKDNQKWDSSTIIITADHGEELFDANRIQGHGEHLWGNAMLHVPLLWKQKNHQKPQRIEHITRSIDLGTTLIHQVSKTQKMQKNINFKFSGQNLNPWIDSTNDQPFPQLSAFSETGLWFSNKGNAEFQLKRLWYPNINELITIDKTTEKEVVLHHDYRQLTVTAKHRSLISGEYKVLYIPTKKGIQWELYQWKKDPHNIKNIAPSSPKKLLEMQEKLLSYMTFIEKRNRIINNFVVPL
ncbi:MAG: sulfatase-like hydrolase/transferase [Oligoflexales bacterium]